MVIDASALLAIFLHEPERTEFLGIMIASANKSISAATVLEAAMVLEPRKGEAAGKELDRFMMLE